MLFRSENHALFILAVFAFTASGLAYAKARASLGWVALSFCLAVLASPLGYALVPALLYLVLTRSRLASRWRSWPAWTRTGLALTLAILAVVWLWRWYAARPSLQLAILPLFRNRLTVDRYTLLSWAHLLDMANLLLRSEERRVGKECRL